MILSEVIKEDDIYFQGPFWIISDSQLSINIGHFQIIGDKFPVDKDGILLDKCISKNAQTHRNVWKRLYADKFDNVPFDYYPRGRVTIHKGTAIIHIHSFMNIPRVINNIVKLYNLVSLDIDIEHNDEIQGSHYDFQLK